MFEQKERLAKRKQLILFNLIQLINYGNGQGQEGRDAAQPEMRQFSTDSLALSTSIVLVRVLSSSIYFHSFLLFSASSTRNPILSCEDWEIGIGNRVRERENARERRGEKNEIQVQLCSMAQTERMDDNRHDLADI